MMKAFLTSLGVPRLAVIIAILSAILTTAGIIAHNSIRQTALIEEATKAPPPPPPLTDKQIDETAQRPIRPTVLP